MHTLAVAVLGLLPAGPCLAQAVSADRPPAPPVEVPLAPAAADSPVSLRWSPKGATVPLEAVEDGALEGAFPLGPAGTPPIRVRLERSPGATHVDRLWIDLDRDDVRDDGGDEAVDEVLETTPTERRGSWWSSFQATVTIPIPLPRTAPEGTPARTRPYPIALWFVEDPREPDRAPALRWSRRGWHEGRCEIDGRVAHVLVTELRMDGVFDDRDAWMLARDPKDLGRRSSGLDAHCWLDGVAYRPTRIDPHGRGVVIERFDPGWTEEEERERQDTLRPDREAPRAERPLAFGTDLDAALEQARTEGRLVFVDFETDWCGPCQTMNRLVYTAAAVVEAAEGVVPVKIDGDEHRDLVRRFGVRGYPTMLVLDPDANVLRRAVGYRGVAALSAFLRGEEEAGGDDG